MFRFLKRVFIALLAALVFIVTTLTGLITGLISALIHAQFPDVEMTESAQQDVAIQTDSAVNRVPNNASSRPAVHLSNTGQ
jgi:uncharacterized iron-regulated membrane protein